jgi:hypothetical protein
VQVHFIMDLEGLVKQLATCLVRQATAAGRPAGQMTMRPLSACSL